jgi:hypothetical protein
MAREARVDGQGGYLITLPRSMVDKPWGVARPRRELQRHDPEAGQVRLILAKMVT